MRLRDALATYLGAPFDPDPFTPAEASTGAKQDTRGIEHRSEAQAAAPPAAVTFVLGLAGRARILRNFSYVPSPPCQLTPGRMPPEGDHPTGPYPVGYYDDYGPPVRDLFGR